MTEKTEKKSKFPVPVTIVFVIGGLLLNSHVFHRPLDEPLSQYLGHPLGGAVATGIWAGASVLLAVVIWTPIQALFRKLFR